MSDVTWIDAHNDAVETMFTSADALRTLADRLQYATGKSEATGHLYFIADGLYQAAKELQNATQKKLDADLAQAREMSSSLLSAVLSGAIHTPEKEKS